ncbi:hypothetical protein RHMOL_Rhmol09G0140400 [Rhododendron molle]|uniref:Uncharacterized protein n=1 Tax=Rhododendron molle TaxID=49168 RepID=A0ACC0MEB4_RHOML|nr:hypothetical protein RHMOL_Rhmol09G0140400 [Rhododendron molle]
MSAIFSCSSKMGTALQLYILQISRWDAVKSTGFQKNGSKTLDEVLNHPEDVEWLGLQDGKLRGFKWPGMEIILDEANAHFCMKGFDFSLDGKFLVPV